MTIGSSRCVMSTSGSSVPDLLDTSAAIAFLVQDHEHHEATFSALADRQLGLAGHAAFETFSVLTRLPSSSRLVPEAAHRLLATNFPHSRFLSSEGTVTLLATLADHRIAGGSVYDALVGGAAAEHGLTLISRDRRALDTYRALNVSIELLA
jgi:predicted nucleic acid-binding protein